MSDFMNRCGCGKFVAHDCDGGVIYGCPNPADPYPHDPDFFCAACAAEAKEKAIEGFKNKAQAGLNKVPATWWHSPAWEIEAAKETGWVREHHNWVRPTKQEGG